MSLLQWFYSEMDMGNPPPEVVYYVIRGVMFLLSFVLEDWAIYELVPSPRHRRATVVLVASSYVTWTYQTHTFSNSLETLLVAWGLVLIRRMVENKVWMTGWVWGHLGLISTSSNTRPSFPARSCRSSLWPASSTVSPSRLFFWSLDFSCCPISGKSESLGLLSHILY
jgi:phosphatidylinositol glycan class Z